jgi:hypothetical protein
MSIPMTVVSVKFHADEIIELKQLAELAGFEGHSQYLRDLVNRDKEARRLHWLALNPIFAEKGNRRKKDRVLPGVTEAAQ